jgi:hypothetical protein
MQYPLYFLGQVFLIALVGAVLWGLWQIMRTGYRRLRVPLDQRQRLLNYNLGFLIFWLAIIAHVAWLGFFTHTSQMPFRILGAMLLPVFAGLVLLGQRGFRLFIRLLPLRGLIWIQTFRIPLEIIQWIGFEGEYVPVQMTFMGLNYDIMVGLSAMLAGSAFFRQNRVKRMEALIWNLFGLALLLNMQVVLIFSVPSPFQTWPSETPYWSIGTAPFIWIPAFLTPVGILAHAYSLFNLGSRHHAKRTFQIRRLRR